MKTEKEIKKQPAIQRTPKRPLKRNTPSEEEGKKNYFSAHPELAFILKSFVLIAVILIVKPFVSGSLGLFLILLFPLFFVLYMRFKAMSTGKSTLKLIAQNITIMPVFYTEKDNRWADVPLVTYSIITINVLVFFVIQTNPAVNSDFIFDNLLFLPRDMNLWNVPVGAVTSIFLHGDIYHLFGNMIFLWAVGTVVEKRIGGTKFLIFYMVTGLLAGTTFIMTYYLSTGEAGHALGASGAISGIMGVYAIRCYFKSMVFPLPILGIFSLILPISLKVRLNSLVILGTFFMLDLGRGLSQLSGTSGGRVAHWAHIGGMGFGILLALRAGLEKSAVEERHLDIGAKAVDKGTDVQKGEESLRFALEKDPDNVEALVNLARIETRHRSTDKGQTLYSRAIELMVKHAPKDAARLYGEYYGKYLTGIAPAPQYRIAGILYRMGEYDLSSRSLELLVRATDTPANIREQATYQCAVVLDAMGLEEASTNYYRTFIEKYPASQMADKVRGILQGKV
ncbi:MAG: rhomboid family intramembrane serine protease [Deltaproteobacteria bacterium]|nr:rhomboid family intramembrane serine protease [Deltaproteobacteria bacterium]